jgi:hypothetical protein
MNATKSLQGFFPYGMMIFALMSNWNRQKMVGQAQLRLIGAGATDFAPGIRAALAELAEDQDDEACFVVTRAGIVWARVNPADPTTFHLCGGDAATSRDAPCTPRWDRENRVLSVAGRIVKRFERRSPNQETVLDAFEQLGWPNRIEDPLPWKGSAAAKPRLHDTIKWLNLKHEHRLLRFYGDGTGAGVCWQREAITALVLHGDPAKKLREAA